MLLSDFNYHLPEELIAQEPLGDRAASRMLHLNRAASAMFMSEPVVDATAINDEVLDAVAELTNMVVGNIKNTLEHTLGPMAISIPSVIYGRNFHFRSLTGKVIASMAFRWNSEPLEVKIVLAPSADHEGATRLRGAVMALSH